MGINSIYYKLGFIGKDGFVTLSDPNWAMKAQLPSRIIQLIQDRKNPLSQMKALFSFGGKPMIFFFDHPENTTRLYKTIWNLNEVPIVIIDSDNHVDVFNGFAYEKEFDSLELIGNDRVLDQFTYFKLVTGEGWAEYKSRLEYHNRVDRICSITDSKDWRLS